MNGIQSLATFCGGKFRIFVKIQDSMIFNVFLFFGNRAGWAYPWMVIWVKNSRRGAPNGGTV
jgi:hypothetical protein